jgi:hypothetical protein
VLGLLPGVEVDEARPSSYESFGAPGGYDVYILDGVQPLQNRPLPGSAMMWGGAGPQFLEAGGAGGLLPVADWDRSQPVLRFVDLTQTSLQAAAWQSVGSWEPLIEDQVGIIAAENETGTRRQLWMSFTPQESGFAAEAAFPIFVSNAVGWLSHQAGQSAAAGTPITLAPVIGGWAVDGPGTDVRGVCNLSGSRCSASTSELAGVYTVRSDSGSMLFARNTDPGSSDILPKPHMLAATGLSVASPEIVRHGWSEVSSLAAALCLMLLAIEWLVYHRPRRPGANAVSAVKSPALR